MKQPTSSSRVNFGGREMLFEEYFDPDFSAIQRKPSQSLGVIINKENEVLLVSVDGNWWGLPGGTIEEGETPEETLIREVYEETAVIIDETYIKPFFYLVSWNVDSNGEKTYNTTQLRFISKVKAVKKFVKDPGGDQQYRKFVPISKIDSELSWKGTRKILKRKLLQVLENEKSRL